MATLNENANAVSTCATNIDNAILAKGGTLVGGGKLRNAVAGIQSIPDNAQKVSDLYKVLEGSSTLTSITFDETFTGTSRSYAICGLNNLVEVIFLASTLILQPQWFYPALNSLSVIRYQNLTTGFNQMTATLIRTITDVYVPRLRNFGERNSMYRGDAPYTGNVSVHIDDSCENIMNYNLFPGIQSTYSSKYTYVKFIGTDGRIEYVDGAWTIITD